MGGCDLLLGGRHSADLLYNLWLFLGLARVGGQLLILLVLAFHG